VTFGKEEIPWWDFMANMFLLIEKVTQKNRLVKMVCNALFASWLEHNPTTCVFILLHVTLNLILCYMIIVPIWK
jgi:hypothetical protein